MKSARIAQLDVIRTVAIISVVLCHSLEAIYRLNATAMADYPPGNKLFLMSMMVVGRIGVPLFIFLTGFLLLPRDYSNWTKIRLFYKRHLLPLLVCWLIWIVVYNIFLSLVGTRDFDLFSMMRQLFLVEAVPMSHSWYMGMIIGVYLFIPIVSNIIKKLPIGVIFSFLGLSFVMFFILPCVNYYFAAIGNELRINSVMDLSFSGGVYGLYLITGYLFYIFKSKLKALSFAFKLVLTSLAMLYFCFTVLFIYKSYFGYNPMHGLWYDFPTLPIMASVIFVLLYTIKIKPSNLFYYISIFSFGIYLTHRVIQILLMRLFPQFAVKPIIKFGALLLVSFALSYITVWIIHKVAPKISKILFLTK